MMGGRRSGPRSRFTSPNVINSFSHVEKVIVVDLFRPTHMSCTVTPTTSSVVSIVSGLGTIYKSLVITSSMSWKKQQSNTFTLVIGVIVTGQYLYPHLPSTSTLVTSLRY